MEFFSYQMNSEQSINFRLIEWKNSVNAMAPVIDINLWILNAVQNATLYAIVLARALQV